MDIVSNVIKFFFGSKSDKDRKQIEPYVRKIKEIYPSIERLSNDELREHRAPFAQGSLWALPRQCIRNDLPGIREVKFVK